MMASVWNGRVYEGSRQTLSFIIAQGRKTASLYDKTKTATAGEQLGANVSVVFPSQSRCKPLHHVIKIKS